MKVFYSNINKINEDVESFVIAKNKIEKLLIEEEKLEAKQSIKDFLNMAEINKVFVSSKSSTMATVAFTIYKNEDEIIILFSSQDEVAIDEFKEIIKSIDYDITKLIHYNQYEMTLDKLTNNPYFIINNEFYLIK